jgi:GNAT superfamily N-acetyltransferase
MEDNEWSFCSLWTYRLRVDDCADVLVNARLAGDYFFNRARTKGCPDKTEGSVAKVFWNRGIDCHLYFSSASNHRVVDKMYTLWLKNHKAIQDSLDVRVIDRAQIPAWVKTFCSAFDVASWEDEVSKIVDASFGQLDLLVCYINDRPAGSAALFRKNNVTGLYCLGTIPEFRGRGVAKSLIRESANIASKHGSLLFVQSLESEGSLALYQKAGFQIVYQKTICLLPRPS